MSHERRVRLHAPPSLQASALVVVALAQLALGSACGGSTRDPGFEKPDGGIVIVLPSADADDPVTDAMGAPDSVPTTSLITIPLSSCVPGEYTATGTIGGSQSFQFAIDTGSTTLGVAAATCASCAVTPEYKPGASSTDENAMGMSTYGTGMWSGEIYRDQVTLGTSPAVAVDFVAIDTQNGFFVSSTMCDSASGSLQGIVGFAPVGSALPGTTPFFDQLVNTAQVPNVFATELCKTGGTLWLGGYDPAATTAAPQYTSTTGSFLSESYYSVDLVSISAAGAIAAIASAEFPDSVVDTGTSVVILPTAAFNTITNAIGSNPAFQQIFGTTSGQNAASYFSSSSNCVLVTQTEAELDAMLPPMTLLFGTTDPITVTAVATESYLVEYDGYWCPALDAMDPTEDYPVAGLLGSPVLRSSVVIFDRANNRVGFAPHAACP